MSQENSLGETGKNQGIRWGWIIFGLIAVALAATLVLMQREGTFQYYMTVSEYLEQQSKYEGSKIKLAGKVKAGSITQTGSHYQFTVEDRAKEISVSFNGIVPDTFKEGVDVVVEGRGQSGNEFEAVSLLAKCASKYQTDGLPPLEQMRSKSRN